MSKAYLGHLSCRRDHVRVCRRYRRDRFASGMTTADLRIRNRAGRRALVVVVGAVCGLIAWTMLGPVAGHDLVVRLGPNGATQRVGPVAVIVTALVAGLAGWGLLAILERLTTHARTIWTVLAFVVLAVSLLGPLNGVDTT